MTAAASISVVVPALDAGEVIDDCLDAILAQEQCPSFDVWIACGPSHDDTEARVRARSAVDDRLHVVANPGGRTAAGLNAAVAASEGELVVRVDAQARIPPGYLARLASTSAATGAANVGGLQRPVGTTPAQRAIAAAMASQFGAGPAAFRSGGVSGPVDTVYLGAFRRSALLAVGGYDERLVRNQDYELNWRLRAAGHTVWLDAEVAVDYRPRGRLDALASQYRQYGRWKRRVVVAHPRSLRLRQLAAPLLVLGLLASAGLAVMVNPLALVVPGLYAGAVTAAALRVRGVSRRRVAAAFVTMHVSWGIGFLFTR